jgi:hypothetical protein
MQYLAVFVLCVMCQSKYRTRGLQLFLIDLEMTERNAPPMGVNL